MPVINGFNVQEGASLNGANFWRRDIKRVNFSGASIRGADFWDADMRGANFKDVNLRGTRFEEVKLLAPTDLTSADLRGATFRGNDMGGVTITIKQSHEIAGPGVDLSKATIV